MQRSLAVLGWGHCQPRHISSSLRAGLRAVPGGDPGTLPDALRVVAAWGFTYKTVAFTGVKANRTRPGFFAGQGGLTRANPEVCLLGTRGNEGEWDFVMLLAHPSAEVL